jgi:hypothetical protein
MKTLMQDFKFKGNFIFLLTLFSNFLMVAQQRGIILENKETHKTFFYPENRRIKVMTSDGSKLVGNYSIIDDKTIMIKEMNISIDSIVMIKSQSLSSAIVSFLFITAGSLLTVGGVVAASTNIYAILLIAPGFVIGGTGLLIPSFGNSHKRKNWDYKVSNRK